MNIHRLGKHRHVGYNFPEAKLRQISRAYSVPFLQAEHCYFFPNPILMLFLMYRYTSHFSFIL